MTGGKKIEELILHVGMHKTGSTSIQKSLSKLPEPRPVTYIDGGEINGSPMITSAFAGNEKIPLADRGPGQAAEAQDKKRKIRTKKLIHELENCITSRAVISAESFMELSPPQLRKAFDLFCEYADHIRIIGYIRPAKSLLESRFAWKIKQMDASFPPKPQKFGCRTWFEKFDSVFGRDNVTLKPFRRNALYNACVVQDFFVLLGNPIEEQYVCRGNDGARQAAAQLVYCYRKHFPKAGAMGNLVDRFAAIGGPSFKVHSEVARSVIELDKKQLEWMEDRIGGSLYEDWEAHDSTSIRRETDLFTPSKEAIEFLSEASGVNAEHLRDDSKAIAHAVAALRS